MRSKDLLANSSSGTCHSSVDDYMIHTYGLNTTPEINITRTLLRVDSKEVACVLLYAPLIQQRQPCSIGEKQFTQSNNNIGFASQVLHYFGNLR